MGITASRDDLCNRDLNQRRKIEELQYRMIEYQREADQVIECAGEIVNRIDKLIGSGRKDTATREELKVLFRQAQKAFKEAKHKERKAHQVLGKANKMIRRLSDFWSPNETAELDQFNPTWNTL
jgi:GTP-sensing pleiotropic transcriptional regulator CodY